MFKISASPRQKEYFTYVARGIKDREIACIMGITDCTVRAYRLLFMQRNRISDMQTFICQYYMNRIDCLDSKITKLKKANTELREEVRKCKDVIRRRQRNHDS